MKLCIWVYTLEIMAICRNLYFDQIYAFFGVNFFSHLKSCLCKIWDIYKVCEQGQMWKWQSCHRHWNTAPRAWGPEAEAAQGLWKRHWATFSHRALFSVLIISLHSVPTLLRSWGFGYWRKSNKWDLGKVPMSTQRPSLLVDIGKLLPRYLQSGLFSLCSTLEIRLKVIY